MYGQMTAGSWIYIATQGILQGTFETFAAVARKRFGGTLAGTLTLTGGCGGMGGAQPLAVTLNNGISIVVDVVSSRMQRRVDKRYLDLMATDLDDAVARANTAVAAKTPLSIGVVGNAAQIFPEMLRRHRAGQVRVDVVTDQTSAHDPLSYLPLEVALEDWQQEAEADPDGFTTKAQASMARHVQAMVGFADDGAEVFDYGNSTATRPAAAAASGRSPSPASCPPTSAPCSAKDSDRSAGWRSPATRRTSTPPTGR